MQGDVKNTYGTGCFLLNEYGTRGPLPPSRGLSDHDCCQRQAMNVEYALEGSVFVAGAGIQWLRDEYAYAQELLPVTGVCGACGPDTAGRLCRAGFCGHWELLTGISIARGTIVGITRGCTKEHFIRATLESIAYQTADVLEAMEKDSGIDLKSLKVDGGASANDFLMQFQADIVNTQVRRPACIETTALGAAYLAGLAVGYWKNRDEIRENWQLSRRFVPSMEEESRKKRLHGWDKAVKCALMWQED